MIGNQRFKFLAFAFAFGGNEKTCCCTLSPHTLLSLVAGGKTQDFLSAAKLFHKAGRQVKVPTYLVPATQKVWADVYTLPVPGCDGKTAAEIFEAAGCVQPAAPSCAACLGGPRDTFARMNEPEVGLPRHLFWPVAVIIWEPSLPG